MVGTLTERNDSGGYSGEGEHLFGSESEQQSERSDAGMMIVQKMVDFGLRKCSDRLFWVLQVPLS